MTPNEAFLFRWSLPLGGAFVLLVWAMLLRQSIRRRRWGRAVTQASVDAMCLVLMDSFRDLADAGDLAQISMGAMRQGLRDLRAARLRRVRAYLRLRRARPSAA